MAMDATTIFVCGLLLVFAALSPASATTTTTTLSTLTTTLDTNGTASTNGTTSLPPPTILTSTATANITPNTTINPVACQLSPCQNNGICDEVTGQCNCTSDFTGTNCDTLIFCPPGACDVTGTINCTVVDKDNYVCSCMPNITGDRCDKQEFCPDDYCDPTGSYNCTVVAKDMFLCNCKPNATGVNCSEENVCYMNPCLNGGKCLHDNSTAGYHCECLTGSLDPQQNCRLNDIQECMNFPPAKPYVTCMDGIGGYHMVCGIGYEGTGCNDQLTLADQCNRYYNNCTNEGFCKPTCNQTQCQTTSNCNFIVTPVFNNSSCEDSFANGYANPECEDEENLFDGFDKYRMNVSDCSPFFWTVCMDKFNNMHCDPQCNTSQCMFDGGDCLDRTTKSRKNLSGAVVIDYKTKPDVKKTQTKLSLLTRSHLEVRPYDRPSMQLMASDDHFPSIERFGQFLSAALSKLPCFKDVCVTTSVTNVLVCEENYYVDDARTGCLQTCSKYCQGTGSNLTCAPTNGHCIGHCLKGYGGPRCDITCPEHCNECATSTSCLTCQFGWFLVSNVCKACEVGCSSTCDMTGHCTCKPGYYGHTCQNSCPNCKNGKCKEDGTCTDGCLPGWTTGHCDRHCPGNCDVCEQTSEKCLGDCKPGFTGKFCKDPVKTDTAEKKRSGSNVSVIVAILISLIIITVIVIICLCYWRKRQSGDYIMGDNEEFGAVEVERKETEAAPASPLVASESHDMIDMDEMKVPTAVYAGPNHSDNEKDEPQENSVEENVVVIQPDVTIEPSTQPSDSLPSVRMIDETDDEADKVPEEADTDKKPDEDDTDKKSEPPKSPTTPTSEPTSPKEPIGRRTSFKTQVSITVQKDGTMEFETQGPDGPPKSPLLQTLAPLASEEDLLSSIGPPKVPDNSPPESDADKTSQKSKSRSSSSSSSSSDDEKKKSEKTTEM